MLTKSMSPFGPQGHIEDKYKVYLYQTTTTHESRAKDVPLQTYSYHNANFVAAVTTCGLAIDDKVGIMTTLGVQWLIEQSTC